MDISNVNLFFANYCSGPESTRGLWLGLDFLPQCSLVMLNLIIITQFCLRKIITSHFSGSLDSLGAQGEDV